MSYQVRNKNTKRPFGTFEKYSDACLYMHKINIEASDRYNDHSHPYEVVSFSDISRDAAVFTESDDY